MTTRPADELHVDYPEPGGVLYANRRSVTGWCRLEGRKAASVELHVDGRPAGRVSRYFRADAASPDANLPETTPAGFRCEFEPSALSPGEHLFEIVARAADEGEPRIVERIRARYDGSRAPCYVSDVFVDVVGFCNLRCAMCPQGDLEGMKADRAMGVMPPELLGRLVDRLLAREMIGEWINLYNWGDPLLHPELDEVLGICTARGLRPVLSTNLSMPRRHVERMLRARTELLLVSLSGMTQETYGQNHRGGRIDRVLRHLELVADAGDAVGKVVIKYLLFDHNEDELAAARDFARANGFGFGVYPGAVPSAESFLAQSEDDDYAEDVRRFLGRPPNRPALASCPQETTVIVDHRGDLEVCCVAWKNRYGGSALTADLRAYLLDKLRNRTCRRCLRSGYAFHKHFGVLEPGPVSLSFGSR